MVSLGKMISMQDHPSAQRRTPEATSLFRIIGETEVVLDYYSPPLKGKAYILDSGDGLRFEIHFPGQAIERESLLEALSDSHIQMSVMQS